MKTIIKFKSKRGHILVLALSLTLLWTISIPLANTESPGTEIEIEGSLEIEKELWTIFGREDELIILTKPIQIFKGPLEGKIVAIETISIEERPWGTSVKALATFYGTLGTYEPGIFTMIIKGVYNPSLPYPKPFRAQIEVITESGTGGFAGISGIGEIAGIEPSPQIGLPYAEYHLHLIFPGTF